ncbi:MAG TPA: hypothetical protein VNM40_01710 [Candidatus Paceibacterota bacterium]|nr:hypothetical protein [Candidatus Paceibacterota bacterium]
MFSIHEIEQQPVLQWVFGATILSYFLAFHAWIDTQATTIDAFARGTHLCWPHFQSCGEWLFLRALPNGYSQTLLYMFLFGTLALAIYCMHKKDWVAAHLLLVLSFFWHAAVIFFLTYALAGNYDYYVFLLAFTLLFLPHKEFFLKLVFVLLYFLSTAAKIHETWIVGTYFSALKTGLPLFPDWSIPFWTNLVMFMEMVAAWFLLSRNRLLQRAVLVFFVAFHLYSGLLVEYRYPATVLPTLVILFGMFYRHTPPPFDRKSAAGWTLVAAMLLCQAAPHLIPGDEKLTMEGNKLGLYMFDANHQCISTTHVVYANGVEQNFRDESASARARCDPYRYWFRIKQVCTERAAILERIQWTLDHSVNGGPFLRIVDVHDACTLSYRGFGHNDWIRTEKDSPPVVGYPVENIYE